MTVIHDLASRDSIWKMQKGRCALLGQEIPRDSSFLVTHEDESQVYGWMGALAVELEVKREIQSSEYAEIMEWIRFAPDPNCPDILPVEPGKDWSAQEREEAHLFAKHWLVVLPIAAWVVMTKQNEHPTWRGYAYTLLSALREYTSKHQVHGSSRRVLEMWSPGAQWQKLHRRQDEFDFKEHQILGYLRFEFENDVKRDLFVMDAFKRDLVRRALSTDITSALFDGSRWWDVLAASIDLRVPPFRSYGKLPTLLSIAAGETEAEAKDSWKSRAIRCHGMLYRMCLAHQMDSEECYDWALYPSLAAVVAAGAPEMDYLAVAKHLNLQDASVDEVNRWVDILSAPAEKER